MFVGGLHQQDDCMAARMPCMAGAYQHALVLGQNAAIADHKVEARAVGGNCREEICMCGAHASQQHALTADGCPNLGCRQIAIVAALTFSQPRHGRPQTGKKLLRSSPSGPGSKQVCDGGWLEEKQKISDSWGIRCQLVVQASCMALAYLLLQEEASRA